MKMYEIFVSIVTHKEITKKSLLMTYREKIKSTEICIIFL